jgi:hypothetical protein
MGHPGWSPIHPLGFHPFMGWLRQCPADTNLLAAALNGPLFGEQHPNETYPIEKVKML